jgi:bifunctional non-homologous end joining protein LigD
LFFQISEIIVKNIFIISCYTYLNTFTLNPMKMEHIKTLLMLCIVFGCRQDYLMAKKKETLSAYRSKRDFTKTPEPSGKTVKKKLTSRKKAIFVIQEHQASHLHYDVRLEIDGVLVSWAVPKGPSLNPRVKRLAVQTEDHPLDYADFEGIIPEGYGAGTVMVWDIGTYKNLRDCSMEQSLKEGQIEVELKGKKLEGAFALVRTHYAGSAKNWLMLKMKDAFASAKKNPVATQKRSALTDRTMNEIKHDKKSKIYK